MAAVRCWGRRAAAVAAVAALCGCAAPPELQPFATDGCSLFPDRALNGRADWCHCCLAHDLAYWRGDSAEARLQADAALRQCVLQAAHSRELADLMFAGVRVGGGPYLQTPYRWAYGWTGARGYAPLSSAEAAQADAAQARYQAGNPTLACHPPSR